MYMVSVKFCYNKNHYKEKKVVYTLSEWTSIQFFKRLWKMPLNCELTFFYNLITVL